MRLRVLYFLEVLLFLIGCTNSINENEVIIDDFPSVETLRSSEMRIPPILLSPSNMCIVDSFMIVSQDRNDSLFSIFSLPNCEHLISFGNKGIGPNEFNLSFEFVTLAPVFKDSSSFAVGNMLTKIRYFKINDIINNTFIPFKTESLPPKLNRFRSITYIGDSLIIGASYGGNIHLFEFNTHTKALESFSKYPSEYPMLNSEIKRDVYGCSTAVNPDNTKLVVAYANMGKIEIFDLITRKSMALLYNNFPSLEENTGLNGASKFWKHNPEEYYFFRNVCTTNKYIYIDAFNDHYSKIFDNDGPRRSFIPEIHVFDWNGNPITKFKLTKYYRYFDIDKEDRFLYTINDNVENVIERYDISKYTK